MEIKDTQPSLLRSPTHASNVALFECSLYCIWCPKGRGAERAQTHGCHTHIL